MPGSGLCLTEAPTSLSWRCQACSEGHRGNGGPMSSRDEPSGGLDQTQESSSIHDLHTEGHKVHPQHQRLLQAPHQPQGRERKKAEREEHPRDPCSGHLSTWIEHGCTQQAENANQDGFLAASGSSCCNFPGLLIDWSQPAHPSPPSLPRRGRCIILP